MGAGAKGGEWILCKHGEITREELAEGMKRAATGAGLVYFRHEPLILHVQCKSLAAATALMEVARAGGYRESGISVGKRHVIVGVRPQCMSTQPPYFAMSAGKYSSTPTPGFPRSAALSPEAGPQAAGDLCLVITPDP